jgi:hypothetical protein
MNENIILYFYIVLILCTFRFQHNIICNKARMNCLGFLRFRCGINHRRRRLSTDIEADSTTRLYLRSQDISNNAINQGFLIWGTQGVGNPYNKQRP